MRRTWKTLRFVMIFKSAKMKQGREKEITMSKAKTGNTSMLTITS